MVLVYCGAVLAVSLIVLDFSHHSSVLNQGASLAMLVSLPSCGLGHIARRSTRHLLAYATLWRRGSFQTQN